MHIWTIIWLNWITILMHVAWNGNKFDQLFILSRAYCFPFYTPQTSLKISPTKLHRPPSCNKSWRRRQSKCSETWIEDNFFSEPWLHARRMSIRIKTQRQPLKIYSKIISIFFAQSLHVLDLKSKQIFHAKLTRELKEFNQILLQYVLQRERCANILL